MVTELHIFISSKMQELAAERQVLRALLPTLGNELVKLSAWAFEEDAPASQRSIREVYLSALKQSALYIGLFWKEYGEWTIDEFQRATAWGIDRHIYVKSVDTAGRDPRLQAFLDEQSNVIAGITPRWFTDLDDLRRQVSRSIAVWLRDRLLRHLGDSSATLAESPDDVPDLPPRLIGRQALLARVRELLEEGTNVLLQGFGGMGKSALAASVAADWLETHEGAVLWLNAGSEEADALLEALARPFGAHQEIASATGSARIKVMRRLLAENAVSLLVLDDVWNGAALSQVLKAVPRQLPVLVTARHRYALDAIVEVGRLEPDEALRLLSHHAGASYKDDPTARELCHQLGYHAFALEVAGKTLKVDQIGPGELMRRLADAPHSLVMPEDFAEEGRTSINELMTASLLALEEDVRQVFLAFGALFTPSATPDLLARCMGRPADEVETALVTLQRRGLADRLRRAEDQPVYYRIHDLAHSYARAAAATPERRRAALEACRAYAADHRADLDALDVEIGNLLGAAEAALSSSDDATLVAIMQTLAGPYLSARGHTLPFLRLLEAAQEAAGRMEPPRAEVRQFLLGKCGNAAYDRGDLPGALRQYSAALEIARELGLRDRETVLLCAAGKVLAEQGDHTAAAAHFEQAASIAAALDDGFLRAFVLEHQGYLAQLRRDYPAARRCFAEEAALAEAINDPETQLVAVFNLGSAEHELGEYALALANHEQALALARRLDNRVWTAHALQSLGEDHHRLGDRGKARQCFEEALALFRECGLKSKMAEVEAYMRQADYPIA
ncbi:MAG: tetratricopeptide repeat protein [Anaerolineae bacterium]|nr:tetratricopeptide repeat protein [Anaerolineae bacterium]